MSTSCSTILRLIWYSRHPGTGKNPEILAKEVYATNNHT
jgi:hypothetical protein